MKINLYIGDSHGKFDNFNFVVVEALKKLNSNNIEISDIISVGDFGYWPKMGLSYSRENLFNNPVKWIDGNHEDFQSLSESYLYSDSWDCAHIPRGTFEDNVFFIGGATSIDKERRIYGHDWFELENISYTDFYKADEVVRNNADSINVMCAHDSIISAYQYLIGGNKGKHTKDSNAEALEQLFLIAQPKVYVHGHHHVAMRYQIDATRFVSLDRCDRIDPDFRACTVAIDGSGEIFEW